MDKRIEKLQKIKDKTKDLEFRKSIDDKIDKLKGNKTINKDGY